MGVAEMAGLYAAKEIRSDDSSQLYSPRNAKSLQVKEHIILPEVYWNPSKICPNEVFQVSLLYWCHQTEQLQIMKPTRKLKCNFFSKITTCVTKRFIPLEIHDMNRPFFSLHTPLPALWPCYFVTSLVSCQLLWLHPRETWRST